MQVILYIDPGTGSMLFTVLIGILFFHDAVTFWRMFFLSLVFIGIVGLKLVH